MSNQRIVARDSSPKDGIRGTHERKNMGVNGLCWGGLRGDGAGARPGRGGGGAGGLGRRARRGSVRGGGDCRGRVRPRPEGGDPRRDPRDLGARTGRGVAPAYRRARRGRPSRRRPGADERSLRGDRGRRLRAGGGPWRGESRIDGETWRPTIWRGFSWSTTWSGVCSPNESPARSSPTTSPEPFGSTSRRRPCP